MEPNNLPSLTELWKWNEIWKVYKFSNCFYEASVSYIQILKFQLYNEPLQVAGLISTWLQASAGADGPALLSSFVYLAHPWRYGPRPTRNFIKGNGPKTNTEEKFSAHGLLKQCTKSLFLKTIKQTKLLKLVRWYNSLQKHFHLVVQQLWEKWPPPIQICSFLLLSVPATPLLLLFDSQPNLLSISYLHSTPTETYQPPQKNLEKQ